MPAFAAYAPGKVILFGEHAVVYGRPAIAAPVSQVRARASVEADPAAPPGRLRIIAPQVGLDADLADLPADHPLALAVRLTLAALNLDRLPSARLHVSSTIPIAAGLGSGAAVSVAAIRALAAYLGRRLTPAQVSAIAFQVEQLHHGTPSGIDNTVISFEKPVYFVRGKPIETLRVARPFSLVIGDTGIASPTAASVGDLRLRWQSDPAPYEALFDAAGLLAEQARTAIENGQPERLGGWMTENHALLQQMGVSHPALDRLVQAALEAGAGGAKLSGGGRGGNMIALVEPAQAAAVVAALHAAGAVHTILTEIAASQ